MKFDNKKMIKIFRKSEDVFSSEFEDEMEKKRQVKTEEMERKRREHEKMNKIQERRKKVVSQNLWAENPMEYYGELIRQNDTTNPG